MLPRETLGRPSLVTVEASRDRLELAHQAGVLEIALDIQETVGTKNSIERMLAAQMAMLHSATMKLGKRLIETTDRMENLIESLLTYSRVGRVDMAFGDTNLTLVVANVLDSLQLRLRELNVEVRIPQPLPTVPCDRVRVAEVFRNHIHAGELFAHDFLACRL